MVFGHLRILHVECAYAIKENQLPIKDTDHDPTLEDELDQERVYTDTEEETDKELDDWGRECGLDEEESD